MSAISSTATTALPPATAMPATASLPAAAPADFAGTNPTPLDQPDQTYPSLITSHVAVLRAIGTPEMVIEQLAASQPQAEYLDRYIQGEIMQNPEGWDSVVGNPQGTARAGLTQLGLTPAAPGTGNAGYMPDGSPVSGVDVPGLSSPLLDPTTGQPATDGGGGLGGFGGILAAVGIGAAGLIGWKFLKNRGAAEGVASAMTGAMESGAKGVAEGGTGNAILDALTQIGKQASGGADDVARDLGSSRQALSLAMVSGGGTAAAHTAATADSILAGLGPANGFINSAGISAAQFNLPVAKAIDAALADRWMGVMETAAKSGQLGDFAASHVAMKQALTGAEGAAGTGAASPKAFFSALAEAFPA